jgi:anti-repressor protein
MNTDVITVETKYVSLFDFQGAKIRTLIHEDGEPWFVAKDLAEYLGYRNPAEAVRDHCKAACLLNPSISHRLFGAPRGLQIVPEADMYRMVMHSHMPAAVEFQKWVCGEVLPSIRKHGVYIMGQEEMTSEELIRAVKEYLTRTIARKRAAKLNEREFKALLTDSEGITLLIESTKVAKSAVS